MYSEENKSSSLAKFLSIYDYVFVDTCSLMEDSFPTFMDTLEASREYWKDGFEVIVIGECVEELKKHAKSRDSQEARIEAKRALKILRHDRWHHRILTITKSNTNNGFADNAIFTTVSGLRIQNKVLIITQDKTLATDLRKLNQLDSQHGRFLAVYRLTTTGELEENPGENPNQQSSRNYVGSSVRSRPQNTTPRSHGGFFHHPRTEESKPASVSVEPNPIEDSNPLMAADKRLCANLSNPNYPLDKKLADIDAQMTALSALSEADRNKLSLAYTLDELLQEKVKLSAAAPKMPRAGENELPLPPKKLPTLSVGDSLPADKKTAAIPAAKAVPEVKAAPEAKPEQPKPFKRAWFEFGYSVQDALRKAGSHASIIIRDASVPYVPMVHGPYDITNQDLDALAAQVGVLKTGESKDLPLKGLLAHIEKTERDYKASLALPEKVEAPVVAKPAQIPPVEVKTPAKPAPIETPKAVKAEKPAETKAVKEPAPKKEAKATKTTRKPRVAKAEKSAPSKSESKSKGKVKTMDKPIKTTTPSSGVYSPDVNTAVPAGVTLVVGVPTDENKKSYIERKVRRETAASFDVVKKPGEPAGVHHASSVSHVKRSKPATKAVSKPAPVNALSGKDEVAKEDKNLNAKINNPNYPVANKIKDLEAQQARLKGLSAAEQKDLFFTSDKIAARLAELKK